MTRKARFTTLAVLMVFAVGIFSCRKEGKPEVVAADHPKLANLTMGTFSKAYGNLPFYVAKHFHWFEQEPALAGIAIKYTEYNDRPAISDALSTGSLHVLFSGDAPALLCRAQGNDIRALAVSGNAEQEVVVTPDSTIRSIEDLRGKKIAVLQATSSHYALLRILQASNLAEGDVTLNFMSPPEARAAFETGKVDAWAVWAPFVEQEQAVGKARVLGGSKVLINSLMSVQHDLIQENPAVAQAVLRSIQRAKRWMSSNPQEAQRIAVEQLGLDPKVVAIAWPKFNWGAQLDDSIAEDLQAKINFLSALDKTRQGKTFDVRSEYLDSNFVGGK